ncbi:MAG TPA: hypothetical protein VF669_01565 [Tepidisphaeraceae bacterium]|jgi:hypothetical protein
MANLRAFNDTGLAEFRNYLMALKNQANLEPPRDLLDDFRRAEPVVGAAVVEPRVFASKLEFGRYLTQALRGHVPDRLLRTSAGVWTWLTLFYFDQACPQDGHGRRKVLSLEKYIPSAGHIATGLDKHLLFFPWKMISLHGADAGWLLGGPLREDNKVVRELSNSYRRNVSGNFIKLAKSLYFDDQTGRVKRGATTHRAGSLRRLDRVVNQLDLTHDVFGVDADTLATLLPRAEFERWLPRPGSN